MSDDEVPLGIVADRLEELGQHGPAAAVRTLAYLIENGLHSLEAVLLNAAEPLRDAGEDVMRLRVLAEHTKLIDHQRQSMWESSNWSAVLSSPRADVGALRDEFRQRSYSYNGAGPWVGGAVWSMANNLGEPHALRPTMVLEGDNEQWNSGAPRPPANPPVGGLADRLRSKIEAPPDKPRRPSLAKGPNRRRWER